MCLIRSGNAEELISQAMEDKAISMEALDYLKIISNFGYELKKHGAMFRLLQRKRFGIPVPNFHYQNSYHPIIRDFHVAPSTGNITT